MDTIHPPLKPFIKELNNTLLKILNELQTIKIQQQDFINIIKEEKVPTNEEVSKGWFFS
tara:strand:+ start:1975 stop:2151 length:177 start_codon:yes stop_codon:yes gene_type:complete